MNKTASTQKSCCKHLPKKCLVIKNMLNKHIYKMCSSTSTSALIGKMVPSTFMFKNLKITKILYPACVTRISLSIVIQYSKLVIWYYIYMYLLGYDSLLKMCIILIIMIIIKAINDAIITRNSIISTLITISIAPFRNKLY